VSTLLQSRGPFAGYSEDEQPLEAYAGLATAFGAGVTAALLLAARRGRL
jgi:hypothetical protein